MTDQPLAYFITFRTYGTWLHGDERGWTDRRLAGHDAPFRQRDDFLNTYQRGMMTSPPVILDPVLRDAVKRAIRETCHHREWVLSAVNVRTEHVHVVVSSNQTPEYVMRVLKARATRQLRESGLATAQESLWSRHGSTRYLWTDEDVEAARLYVVEGQGQT